MGTEVNLSVNKLTIDWGKNNSFTGHFWLFDNSNFCLRHDDWNYSDGELALSIKLSDVKFRMNVLGYSLMECENRFKELIERQPNGTYIVLNFQILQRIIFEINLPVVTDRYIFEKNYESFYDWLADRIRGDHEYSELELAKQKQIGDEYWDDLDYFLLEQVGPYILLRLFCENDNNSKMNLNWYCHEVIENGWVSLADIEYIDENMLKVSHDAIYGRLQEIAIQESRNNSTIASMDKWLKLHGAKNYVTNYIKVSNGGRTSRIRYTTPTFVRNVIHHPENKNNSFSKSNLINSINTIILILKSVLPDDHKEAR
ncbi:HEPN/Toprim-associated domain-containing protein [Lacticaseibacillus daqingensis]|uniref:HEPN/Toprim-associated domain-containing protein n=1 Tax=Lacticaseibacillus daqingensis TaxID=2486014 RepID=UPI000F779A56|nr:HEPN/Toprim-associated domain-containing protein [Lacticaseibacillus daqingensis]